ncbi:ATP-binding protein [Colwellia sp. KU-HH00111]|uniref:ATP-binding protein n=1 Tax=Colwellia sp. KU-HH00111 TaxID=3127652 RepID=UPI003106F4DF
MLRLFISLYLAVVLGLLTINWISETLWQYLSQQVNSASVSPEQPRQPAQYIPAELTHTLALAKSLPGLIQANEKKIALFEQQTGITLNFFAESDISWLPDQQMLLQQGEPLVTYNHQEQWVIYVKSTTEQLVYQLGPLAPPVNEQPYLKYIILSVSYLLLAAFLALWSRPIWTDLLRLKNMAEKITLGDLEVSQKVNIGSPTAIVVQTFIDMASRITRLIAEQQQLVNAVSHELRTPLSRLRFSLAMMNNIDAEQLIDINKDVQEMENLIDEMLGYARIESISQGLDKSNVNISELLFNQVDKHQRATSKKLTLTVEQDLYFHCHGSLIERACQNLITNAVRYAKGQVVIAASIEAQQLMITVSDDGCGIATENQAHIFEPFARINKSRNKKDGGFGLGLAIVKRIIDLHQGQCSVESSSLGGCKFIIRVSD